VSTYGWDRREPDADTVVVELSGELDLTNARELEERLLTACGPDGLLAVDLRSVHFVDSAALHVLFKLARARGREGLLILRDPSTGIASTIAVVGLDRVVRVQAALEAAGANSD